MADWEESPPENLLIVEGQDDKHVVQHLCYRSAPMPEFSISDKDGIARLLASISPEIKAPGRRSLGILVDANDEPENRWKSVGSRLEPLGFKPPEEPEPDGTILSAVPPAFPRIGIWMWPDNRFPGELEHFVKSMIPEQDPVWPRSEQYIGHIPESDRKFPPGKEMKAKIYAWLATTEAPGRMGTAIKAHRLDVDGPLALKFAGWLRRLFA